MSQPPREDQKDAAMQDAGAPPAAPAAPAAGRRRAQPTVSRQLTEAEQAAITAASQKREAAKAKRLAATNAYKATYYGSNDAGKVTQFNAIQPYLKDLKFFTVKKTSQSVKSVFYFKWGKNSWGIIVGDGN